MSRFRLAALDVAEGDREREVASFARDGVQVGLEAREDAPRVLGPDDLHPVRRAREPPGGRQQPGTDRSKSMDRPGDQPGAQPGPQLPKGAERPDKSAPRTTDRPDRDQPKDAARPDKDRPKAADQQTPCSRAVTDVISALVKSVR